MEVFRRRNLTTGILVHLSRSLDETAANKLWAKTTRHKKCGGVPLLWKLNDSITLEREDRKGSSLEMRSTSLSDEALTGCDSLVGYVCMYVFFPCFHHRREPCDGWNGWSLVHCCTYIPPIPHYYCRTFPTCLRGHFRRPCRSPSRLPIRLIRARGTLALTSHLRTRKML